MPVIDPVCGGIAVHAAQLAACPRRGSGDGHITTELHDSGTMRVTPRWRCRGAGSHTWAQPSAACPGGPQASAPPPVAGPAEDLAPQLHRVRHHDHHRGQPLLTHRAGMKSVNLFREDVNHSQTLLTLFGRSELATCVAILYQSNVQQLVPRRNLEAPTGVLAGNTVWLNFCSVGSTWGCRWLPSVAMTSCRSTASNTWAA